MRADVDQVPFTERHAATVTVSEPLLLCVQAAGGVSPVVREASAGDGPPQHRVPGQAGGDGLAGDPHQVRRGRGVRLPGQSLFSVSSLLRNLGAALESHHVI